MELSGPCMSTGLIGLSLDPDGSVVQEPWPCVLSIFVSEGREADLAFL